MYLFLALAAAALAVLFWKIALRVVLIVLLFLVILGIAALMGQTTGDRDPAQNTHTAGTPTA